MADLARIGVVTTLYLNGSLFLYDVTCHVRAVTCDYQFEAVGLTSTASDTGLEQPNVGIRSYGIG